jgi:bacteriocin biosynthesis cyclodehydratase domain-containing protein
MAIDGFRRPKLSLPYTILHHKDTVRLVAGEDFRYTFTGPEVEKWMPLLLAQLDGTHTVQELLSSLEPSLVAQALQFLERLYGERISVDAPVADSHKGEDYYLAVEGEGALCSALGKMPSNHVALKKIVLFCQDSLNYRLALQCNERCLEENTPWMWASYGAMNRAYLGPLFLPRAGPCLNCLLNQFRQLSPVPELYEELMQHGQNGLPIMPVPFPETAVQIMKNLILWKVSLTTSQYPPSALYRLHVLEITSMEINTYRILRDPECSLCHIKKK